jgi:hypothetical protein
MGWLGTRVAERGGGEGGGEGEFDTRACGKWTPNTLARHSHWWKLLGPYPSSNMPRAYTASHWLGFWQWGYDLGYVDL